MNLTNFLNPKILANFVKFESQRFWLGVSAFWAYQKYFWYF